MDENNKLRSQTFEQLKKVCDELITNLTQENVRNVIETVKNTPSEVLVFFSEYVIFPVRFHLYKFITTTSKFETNSVIELIRCLRLVIKKSVIESGDTFVNLNILLLRVIMDNEKFELNTNVSEDLKYEVICCVNCLYKSLDSQDEILKNLYNAEKKLVIHSQAVYACTQLAKVEKMVKLRTEALKCLLTIMRIHEVEILEQSPTNLKWHLAEIAASIFPGIISSCYVILMSNSILHRDILVVGNLISNSISNTRNFCIRLFCRSLTLVFSETEIMEENTTSLEVRFSHLILNRKNIAKDGPDECNPKSIRTDAWVTSTTEKLSTLVHCLVHLCNNKQRIVKHELVVGVQLVLKSCGRIESVKSSLLHVLVTLSLDEEEVVSIKARETLTYLLDQPYPRGSDILQNLEESFFHSLEAVHSAMNNVHENILISQLNLLNGMLHILDLERLFKSSVYLERLINVLVSLVRFDATTVITLDGPKIQDLSDIHDEDLLSYVSWRNMKHLSHQTEIVTKNIFDTLSRKLNLESLSYYFLDTLETDAENRKEIVYLVNNIIFSERLGSHDKRIHVVKTMSEVYLDSDYWTSSIREADVNRLSLALIRNNLLQVCLLTEGIGNMAICLQGDFKPFLIHCLYLIIERAGSANKFLSSIGLMALQKMTTACGYNHIIELMSDNVDLIMYRATLMLRHLQMNPQVFDVFCVIIAYSRKDSLSVLCEVIESLLENDNIVDDKYSSGFLRVFAMFIRRLRCWFVSVVEDECMFNESDDKLSEILNKLCNFYASRQQRTQVQQWSMWATKDELVDLEVIFRRTEYDLDDTSSDDEKSEALQEGPHEPPSSEVEFEEPDKKVAQHIKLVIIIVEKILHILPHRNTQNKILIIETLIDSLLILFDYGEDELLPIVHKIWSPLVNRFEYDKSEALLMRRCFELLCVMATTAKDFLKSRTLKSIQPVINQFLLDASEESRLKDKKSVYRMSQRYKLQLTLLCQLGFLAVHLNFQENEIHSLLVASTPYLSGRQPLPLQDACMNLFSVIESEYPDFVKIYLLSLCEGRSIFRPPINTVYHPIYLKGTNKSTTVECQKNIFKLLENKLPDCWSRLDG